MVLQGVIPICLIGFAVPIGLIALALAIESAPMRGAVDHGELFLSASNAGFVGCISLIASRTDEAVNVMITAMIVLAVIILPGYVGWALLSVHAFHAKEYSDLWPIGIGGFWAVLGVAVGLALVRLSYRPALIPRSSS
jgi:hypothetical protein